MEKYEYRTLVTDLSGKPDDSLQRKLNKLGDEGWEMVGMATNTGVGSSKYALVGITSYVLSVFKRQRITE